jgi:hypothetical protein
MFASGLVAEWQLDANKQVRRFNDPYWMQANPLSPSFTVWQSLCMANLGYSIPLFEIDNTGQWVSNIPSTTTTTTTTTTTIPPTTTTTPLNNPIQKSVPKITDDYDWFDAEWDGYPFEATVLLLEQRYPPNTPDKFHFRLSVAVEFLRQGGLLQGLDNTWNGDING